MPLRTLRDYAAFLFAPDVRAFLHKQHSFSFASLIIDQAILFGSGVPSAWDEN
jgi:hypothetical protein